MSVVPEMCMQYTEVFNAVRLEAGIATIIGVVIGALAVWLGGKR